MPNLSCKVCKILLFYVIIADDVIRVSQGRRSAEEEEPETFEEMGENQ